MKKQNKKGINEVGIGIVVMALLLLFGGIFFNGDGDSFIKDKNGNSYNNVNKYLDPEHDDYIFFMNNTEIGRQNKVVDSFPNIELGGEESYNVLYQDNNFFLTANPFSGTYYSFFVPLDSPQEVKNLLVYFNLDKSSGSQNLILRLNDQIIYNGQARSSESPLSIPINVKKNFNMSANNSNDISTINAKITIEIEKPAFYSLFNWNKFEVKNLKILERRKTTSNNLREFSFQIDKEYLDNVYARFVIACDSSTERLPIEIDVNGYTLDSFIPECTSKFNTITKEIPKNILNENNNKLSMSTEGFYKIAYSFNKVYFNDKDVYFFDLPTFNGIYDAVIYGEFDTQIIDIRLNDEPFSIESREMKNIINYLETGKNKLEILTKPVLIKELRVEKSTFYED